METLSRSQGDRAGENQRRAEVGLAGEQLRLRLHNAKLIKDRCQDTRTYPNCLVGKELVDWLVEHSEAPDRQTAVSIMQRLMDYNVVYHVCDEHVAFKDAKLLYRFRNDDGTLSPSKQVKICVRGQRLYEMIISQEESILQVREQGSERYRRTFLGRQILDWLLDHGEVSSREEGVKLCRELLEHGIIQDGEPWPYVCPSCCAACTCVLYFFTSVSGHQHFSDSEMLFQFTINFRRRRKLIEVLNDPDPFMDPKQESPDSPSAFASLAPISLITTLSLCDIWSLGITAIEMAEGKPPYADQYPVEHLIREAQPPKLQSNRWSQHFVSFLEWCLKKDPSARGSAEELLQHPFISQLPPKKIVRAELEEHLLTLHNWPAKKGLKGVALWTLRQLRCACTQTSAEQEAALQMALEGFSCY